MKLQIVKSYESLGDWKKKPRGYAVVKVSDTARVETVETGRKILLVRISSHVEAGVKQLEKNRELFDIDPNGMFPRLIVVKSAVADDPRAEQFMRRAAVIVEV